jgi:hypothetical protein
MKKEDVIKYFGTQTAAAKALGCSQSRISEWGKYPPIGRQYQIELLTQGKLKAEPKRKTKRK